MKRIMAAALIAFSTTPASASDTMDVYLTGEDLLAECRTSLLFCTGYAMAIIDVLSAGETVAGWEACPPDSDASYEEFVDVLVGYLNDHPDTLHEAAVALAAIAFSEAYPCGEF